jgi:hypothetical protein
VGVISLDRKTVTVLSRDIIQAGCEDAALRAEGNPIGLMPPFNN